MVEALSAAETRYRELLDSLQEVVINCDQYGIITYVNPAWSENLGYDMDEAAGRSFQEYVHPADVQWIHGSLTGLRWERPQELRLRHRNCSYVWFEISLKRKGHCFTGLLYNVNDRKDYENKLRRVATVAQDAKRVAEEQNWFNESLRMLSEATRGEIEENRLCNNALQMIVDRLGFASATLYYLDELELHRLCRYQLDESETLKIDERVLTNLREIVVQGEGTPEAGTWMKLDVPPSQDTQFNILYAFPIRSQNELTNLLVIECTAALSNWQFQFLEHATIHIGISLRAAQEIKAKKALNVANEKAKSLERQSHELMLAKEIAESATKAKSSFLANISHEIRTPLTAIVGFSELLLDESLTESERYDSVTTIIRSGNHLLGIINDILDLSKIEADKLDIEALSVCPFEVLSDIKSFVSLKAQEKGIRFNIDYIFPLPRRITSDPVRLKQILLNLCSNAVKFVEKGYVAVRVSYLMEECKLQFEVVDTGIGLSHSQLGKIFDAFVQGDTSTTRHHGGTGLGLCLSKQLAEMLGGDITVESTFGEGSRFTLTVDAGPLEQGELIYEREIVTDTAPAMNYPAKARLNAQVLLVEDNPDNQRLISYYLRKLGANVAIAENGKKGLDMALRDGYDVVLMDMQMPIIDGVEATTRLRGLGYNKPIIALTANVMKDDVAEYEHAGCDDFLSKPVDRSRFIEVITKYLDLRNESNSRGGAIFSTLLADDIELADLVLKFSKKLPGIVRDIELAAERRDWKRLGELTHDLKSVGGGYGYDQLSETATCIDKAMNRNDQADVFRLITELRLLCDRIVLGAKNIPEQHLV